MAVVVLPPQDCLLEGASKRRSLVSPPRSKPRRSTATNNPCPRQASSGRRKNLSPASSQSLLQSRSNNTGDKSFRPKSPGITGQIRILRRGEELPPIKPSTVESTPVKNRKTKREGSLERENSDPADCFTLMQKIPEPAPAPILNSLIGGFYAGSAFSTSPPPSSLPVPGFCTKSMRSCALADKTSVEDVVAVDLRRMLRLDF